MKMNYKEERKEVDLMKYWKVIVKRKWVIVTFAGILVFFTGIFSFLATPMYKSTATLHIDEEFSKMLSIDDTFGYQTRVVRDLRFFNTQLRLIKSKSLAERVVRKLNLLSRREFSSGKKPKKSLFALMKDIITFKWIRPKKKSRDEKPKSLFPLNPYSGVAAVVRSGIEVSPIRDTKLIEVSYVSPFPVLAAEVVNTLAEEFIYFSIEKRYETTKQASDFLSEQIADIREDLTSKERELQRYGQSKEMVFLSPTESTAVNKLVDLNDAYTQAQINRIDAEVAYLELKDLEVDSLPQFVNNPVIQQLITEYTRLKTDYEEKSKIFKPNYPEMIQLKAKLDSMKGELDKAVDAAESEYNSALNKEASLKKLLDKQKEDVVKMDSNAIHYNSLKIEVENKRKMLNSLMERQNATLVSARLGGLKSSNISIIDKAEIPRNPISPKKTNNLIIALIIGLFGGGALCFVFEYLDNTIKGNEDVERLAGISSLGVIPYLPPDGMSKKKWSSHYFGYRYSYGKENHDSEETLPEIKEIELVNYKYPMLSISEDYRTIRTSILLSHAESPPKTIVFSSAMPQEGKSVTVANMAVSFSQLEYKVLVIDADLRKPRLHKIFNARNVSGLSGYLTGKVYLKDAYHKTSIENIWLLPSGLIPPNPSELLNSKKMKDMMENVKNGFDVILIDTPPVLAVVDAVIIASQADSTVFIVQAGKSTYQVFYKAVEELRRVNAKIIGILFNEMKMSRGEYPYMDYYRSSRYRDYGEEEQTNK